MSEQPSNSSKAEMDTSLAYVQAWHARTGVLESERLRDLRALSERDSARRFMLLQNPFPVAPKSTSGLIELQRVFSRLRQTPW